MSASDKNSNTMVGRDTISPGAAAESTVRAVVDKIEYVIGPNMITGFNNEYIATSVASIAGIRRSDSRDEDGVGTQT